MDGNELLNKIESRSFSLRDSHNSSYFTFIGFIITISGVFLGFKEDLTNYTKYTFLSTIIVFVIGFWFYFKESENLIKRSDKIYEIIAEALDEGEDNVKSKLDSNLKKNCREKFITKAYIFLQNLGLILFLAGIISFMVCGK